MSDRLLLERAIEAVADGQTVDWDLLDSQASDTEMREELACLRILGDLQQLHASTAGDDDATADGFGADGDDDDPPAPNQDSSTTVELGLWGRFRLLAKIGQGSFGRVYRAWDPNLEREVALKILRGASVSEALRERILHEGRALARIRDINVVDVHGVEWHDGRAALCMEFVRGHTLDDVVFSDGRLAIQDVIRIGRDVCSALSAVHRSGFVHRDVKARNVMREPGGRIVLMDFGAGQPARRPDSARGPDPTGTPLYMAPELFDGEEASPRSDVYSVAVLLFYLLTGEYPRDARTITELRAAHRAPFRPLRDRRPEVPASLARVIERGLAANPRDRFPHAAALLEALDRQQVRESAQRGTRLRWKQTAMTVCVGASVMLAVGSLTSFTFDHTLGRSGFSGEGWGAWLIWGLRASVAPAFVFVAGWLVSAAVRLGLSLILAASERATAIDAAFRRTCRRSMARWGLDDPSMLATAVVLLTAGGLAAIWWSFLPLLEAVSTYVTDGPPETLALLSPKFEWYQDRYRQACSLLLLAGVVGWQVVRRMAARDRQALRTEVVAAAAMVAALVVVSLDLPYRLMVKNKFEVAHWQGNTCYVLGVRGSDTLLFCPGLSSPRRRVVSTPAEVRRAGRVENIYTAFAPARAAP